MKRAISILLALVMILALVACTGNPQTSDNSTPQQHARIGIRGRKEIYGRLCTERSGRSAERDLSASGKILRGKEH